MQLVSGSMASIVVATIPLFVPFGMAIAYKERIQVLTLAGIVLSLVGLGVMLLFGGVSSEHEVSRVSAASVMDGTMVRIDE